MNTQNLQSTMIWLPLLYGEKTQKIDKIAYRLDILEAI